jgi:hypothetical protein
LAPKQNPKYELRDKASHEEHNEAQTAICKSNPYHVARDREHEEKQNVIKNPRHSVPPVSSLSVRCINGANATSDMVSKASRSRQSRLNAKDKSNC